MYHYSFGFHIFSSSLNLEDALKKIPCPQNLEFLIDTSPLSGFFSAVYEEHCFILLDLSAESGLAEDNMLWQTCGRLVRSSKKPRLLLYAGNGLVNSLSAELLELFEEIWSSPLCSELIGFHYKKFIAKLKMEKDYRMTESYLNSTINSIPDLIWYKDVKGAHLKVNDGFCEAVGKTKQDCEGRGHYYIWDLKKEEYEKGEFVCLETEEIVLREKKTCLFDEKVKSKGGMRQFKTHKSPLFDEFGNLVGTVGIAHDVTDFDNISTEIDIILQSLPFAGLLSDVSGEIVNVNEKFLEYFGITKESIVHTNYPYFRKKMFGISALDAQGRSLEVTLDSGDEKLVLEMQETVIYDVFDQAVGYFCIYRDITEHKRHLDLMKNYQTNLETDVKKQVKLNQVFQKNMLIGFADIISSRDTVTGGHIKRTSKYVELLVNAMKQDSLYEESMDESFIDHIYLSAPLHDIGKVSIPDAVLLKPGKYNPSEYEIMKRHTNLGGQILDTIMPDLHDSEYYHLSRDMAKYHHERWDGTGYPEGLKGAEIPLCARIMAIADVFDALTSERPYKAAFRMEEARKIILDGRGTHFDPAIIDIFEKNFHLIENEAEKLTLSIPSHVSA